MVNPHLRGHSSRWHQPSLDESWVRNTNLHECLVIILEDTSQDGTKCRWVVSAQYQSTRTLNPHLRGHISRWHQPSVGESWVRNTNLHDVHNPHLGHTSQDATKCRWVVRLSFVASLKLYVPLAKEPYKRDDILQKRPTMLRSLLTVATP